MKFATRGVGFPFGFLWLLVLTSEAAGASRPEPPRFRAMDLKRDFATDELAMFAKPVHMAFLDEFLTVVDAEDATVSIFDEHGKHIDRIGGKGQGPGRLDSPTSAWPDAGGFVVSDGRNRRIVRLNAQGRERERFRTAFFPEAVLPLSGDRVLVARNPGAWDEPARILNCYSRSGRPLWTALPPAQTGSRVMDTMMNVVLLLGGGKEDIFVVHRYREAGIRRFSADGRDLGEIRLGREYPVRKLKKTVGPGRTLRPEVFCWHAAYADGRFYLLAADWTEDDDLGPGSLVYVGGTDGRIREVIELPERMAKIAASPERLYAIDLDYRLRVLKVEK